MCIWPIFTASPPLLCLTVSQSDEGSEDCTLTPTLGKRKRESFTVEPSDQKKTEEKEGLKEHLGLHDSVLLEMFSMHRLVYCAHTKSMDDGLYLPKK